MAKIKLGKWEVEEAELKREIAEATRRGKEALKTEPRVQAARFDPAAKQLVIELHNGCVCSCPADLLPGLRGASAADLADFELMPGGFDLHWKRLDVQYTVAGLLDEFISAKPVTARRAAAATLREASRANGKKRKLADAVPVSVRPGRKAA